jgi:hypothetical protein
LFEISKTEPTAVRTPIGYVQVEIVIKPIDRSGFFFPIHPFLQVPWNGIQAFIYLTFLAPRENGLAHSILIGLSLLSLEKQE